MTRETFSIKLHLILIYHSICLHLVPMFVREAFVRAISVTKPLEMLFRFDFFVKQLQFRFRFEIALKLIRPNPNLDILQFIFLVVKRLSKSFEQFSCKFERIGMEMTLWVLQPHDYDLYCLLISPHCLLPSNKVKSKVKVELVVESQT